MENFREAIGIAVDEIRRRASLEGRYHGKNVHKSASSVTTYRGVWHAIIAPKETCEKRATAQRLLHRDEDLEWDGGKHRLRLQSRNTHEGSS